MVVRGRLAFDDQGRLVEISEDAQDPNNPQPDEIQPVEFAEIIADGISAESVSTDESRVTRDSEITVNIPSDYATLQDATDDLAHLQLPEGLRVNLNVEDGHQPDSGINASHGDYSRFRVTADGGSFSVGDNWSGQVIKAVNGVAPTLATDVDMRGIGGEESICVELGDLTGGPATGWVEEGVTITEPAGHAFETWQGSILGANNTTIENGANRTIHATHASIVSFRNGVIDGSSGDAVYASHGSTVNCRGTEVYNTDGAAMRAQANAQIAADTTETIIDGADIGLWSIRGSIINSGGATISNTTSNDIEVYEGGIISMGSSASWSSANVSVNTVTGDGIIFDGGA